MADYNSLQRKRNMIVGGFVLVGFCGLVFMLGLFGELPGFVSQINSFQVLVDFPQAPGVMENTRVNYCGYQVGRVTEVFPPERAEGVDAGEHFHRVRVEVSINRQFYNIPKNVDVLLIKRGLGSSYIELAVDPDDEITEFLTQGDILVGREGTSTEFIPKAVQEKLERLVDSISELTQHANEIVGNDENKANIKRTLANVASASKEAEATLVSVRNFADKGSENFDEITRNLSESLAEVQTILAKINSGEGTAGQMVNDPRLYENLLDSTLELQMALEQIKMFAADSRENGLRIKW